MTAQTGLAEGTCPFCGSSKIGVLKTQRPFRRLHCRVCGRRWKTVELVYCERDDWLGPALRTLLGRGFLARYLGKLEHLIGLSDKTG